MTTTNKIILIAGLFCSACSNHYFLEPETSESGIKVNVNINGWDKIVSRSVDGDMYPINLLFTKSGEAEIVQTVNYETEMSAFEATLDPGDYDMFVTCGLPSNIMPTKITDALEIEPNTNFATGFVADITVSSGTQKLIDVNAARQNSWLEVELTNVPSWVTSVNLYLKGLHDIYSLDNEWKSSSSAAGKYTKVNMTKNAQNANIYEANTYTFPSANRNGLTYIIEVSNSNKTTDLFTYTSNKPLLAGTHMKQTLAFTSMTLITGDVTVDDWNETQDEGEISSPFTFTSGEQYFTYPATVINNTDKLLTIFPHKPLTVTYEDILEWEDYDNLDFRELDELTNVNKWTMPTSMSSPLIKFTNILRTVGLEELNRQIKSSGCTPIDSEATNIIAYYNKATDTLYRYDFTTSEIVAVEGTPTGNYLFYPFGYINIK